VADWGEGRGEHLAPPQESSMRIKKMTALQKLHILNKKGQVLVARGGGEEFAPPPSLREQPGKRRQHYLSRKRPLHHSLSTETIKIKRKSTLSPHQAA